MPKKVEECVDSILDDNPDMDESTAWAICNDQFSEEKLLSLKNDLDLSEKEFADAMRLLAGCTQPSDTDEKSENGASDGLLDWTSDGSRNY